MALQPGQKLHLDRNDTPKYIVQGFLGAGGMGSAYRATHCGLQATVVIKTPLDRQNLDDPTVYPQYLQGFKKEAEILALLMRYPHGHIAGVLDWFTEPAQAEVPGLEEELLCLVLQWVETEPGREHLGKRIPVEGLGEAEAVTYVQQIGAALNHLHRLPSEKPVVHRDVKPSNIVVRRSDGQAILVDFGLARQFLPQVTQTYTAGGTPGYAAPEQFDPRTTLGSYTDVYGLAATLYHLVTGSAPPPSFLRELEMLKYQRDLLVLPDRLSEPVQTAIRRGMALAVGDRSQTMGDWLSLLAGVGAMPDLVQRDPTPPTVRGSAPDDGFNLADLGPPQPDPFVEGLRQVGRGVKQWAQNAVQAAQEQQAEAQRQRAEAQRQQEQQEAQRRQEERQRQQQQEQERRQAEAKRQAALEAERERERRRQAAAKRERLGREEEEWKQPLDPSKPVILSLKSATGVQGVPLELLPIPRGTFWMGQTEAETQQLKKESGEELYQGLFARELPRHPVTVPPFWMGRYPVTQGQYEAVMGSNPATRYDAKFVAADKPVVGVSWDEAVAFCQKLTALCRGELKGGEILLPTEAQWEYACRAGTETAFHFGDRLNSDQANFNGNYFNGNYTYNGSKKGEYRQVTTPVGCFPANGWGLQDMHGNVWEWCLDHWHDSYNNKPRALHQNGCTSWVTDNERANRLLRGGSWGYYPRNCRSACRNNNVPGVHTYDNGCRVVCCGPRTP
ncbi:bifunctional serine/threonine-protein kinase/formylglycine-generating enzyme family protein [Prochlorothrix hollandica]|uniref:bifunctional serine/threonine-protein kinase/formylglycine-generating enzyme family protein n=1 Tax=Prochlorothrix hollandica TaxID=1223 RepID=UPI003342D20B